jgi:glycosyltransferase involved in cell wall biosynthesis
LLEAMATGLPVVATAVGGIPDVVERGFNGFLVGVGDVARLRGELTTLSGDWRLAQRVGQAARRRVLRRYSVERMAADYERLYASCLARRRERRETELEPVVTP